MKKVLLLGLFLVVASEACRVSSAFNYEPSSNKPFEDCVWSFKCPDGSTQQGNTKDAACKKHQVKPLAGPSLRRFTCPDGTLQPGRNRQNACKNNMTIEFTCPDGTSQSGVDGGEACRFRELLPRWDGDYEEQSSEDMQALSLVYEGFVRDYCSNKKAGHPVLQRWQKVNDSGGKYSGRQLLIACGESQGDLDPQEYHAASTLGRALTNESKKDSDCSSGICSNMDLILRWWRK